jgi:cholesterol transport system auxiliary component
MTVSPAPPGARRPWLALAGVALALAACAAPPPQTFDLSVPPGAVRQRGTQLAIALPVGIQVLETDRIIVRSGDGSVTALPGVQWADNLPRLIQSRLVQAFENTGRAVGRAGSGVSASTVLAPDIRFFGIVTAPQTEAVVELSVKMVDANSGSIVAGRVFRSVVPVAVVSGPAAAAALDQAAMRTFSEIVRWSAGKGAPRPPGYLPARTTS